MSVDRNAMLDKLQALAARYDELLDAMADPRVLQDQQQFQQAAREQSSLEETVSAFREYQRVSKEADEAASMVREEPDPELREFARAEEARLRVRQQALEAKLRDLLTPKDPLADRNIIMEIRAGAGGEEAGLFAGDLFRMYSRYAERNRWKVEVLQSNPSALGGFKEIIFSIQGRVVYRRLKYESGVHRVQRVPATESSGRIHTSTATVAVLPEADDVQIEVNEKDLRVDTFCATGPGGQGVNTTYSAIRITHLRTGMVVQCQDERSQHKNKARAMKVLLSRMLDLELQKQKDAIARDRRSQVGTGERSEKIRTYNFPQNRVTDHRVNIAVHRLPEIMEGDIDPIIEPVVAYYQAEALKE